MKIIALSFLALVAAAEEPAAPMKASADSPAKAVYAAKCASCHGKDAKGNPKLAKMFKLTVADLDLQDESTAKVKDEDLIKIIAAGKGKMPAFKGKLKEAEIAEMVVYLRSLAAPKVEAKAEAAGQ